MIASIPATLRLDNAANIYPASMSKHYSSLYRMKVSLTDPIDISILQEALLSVSERIPTFRCTLKAGAFWWYLKRINATPSILPLTPLRHPDFKEQKGLLYRVSAEDASIYLDVFHALADGNGALCFLLTLTGEYIRLKYGASIRYNRLVLDPKLRPAYFEVEDSFKTVFSGRHGQLEQNVDAYHIRGHALPHAAVRDLRAVIQMDQIQAVCKRFACTVTELLTAAMLWALQEEHRNDPSEKKRSVLKVSVPVNLRPLYDSRTVRNFSSYVNLGVDIKDGYLSFEQLVSAVKAQKAHDLQREQLEQNVDAYHIRGHALPHAAVRDLRAVIQMEQIQTVCRRFTCTVTELLTAAMLWALQEEYRNDPSEKKRSVLKVSVPVNLRPLYDSRTVRNFSSYVNLGVDIKDGYLSFEQLVSAVKAQKAHDLQKEHLEPKIAANVELEEMFIVRMLPLALKHPIIDIINLLHGDRFCSQTLSNMGLVQLPEAMTPYVKDLDFILGRQRGNSGAFSCVGYNGKLYLHMTRKTERNAFEQAFLGKLSSLGIGFQLSLSNLA